jgi:beta-galactosidase
MRFYEIMHDEKIAGSVIAAFSDWRTDRPAMTTNSPDAYMQTMGIVSYEREKRVAFDVVRSLFNNEKVQALPVGNYSASTPIIYVIAGLVILISLAFAYNANRRFRDSIHRSLFRTYNFFADVRDQRILTYPQSVFLMLVVALTWGTMLSAVFSHYRHDLLLDNILSQFMSDSVKNWFVHLVWSPLQFILVVSALVIIKIIVITCVVMLFSMTVRTYVYFYHALSITAWSMLPFIVLIPIAMILYRLMDTEFYILPVLIFVVFVTLWVFIRLLKGISIIYDVYPMRVYAGGIIFLLIFLGALYGYLDYTQSTSVYLKFLLHTLKV